MQQNASQACYLIERGERDRDDGGSSRGRASERAGKMAEVAGFLERWKSSGRERRLASMEEDKRVGEQKRWAGPTRAWPAKTGTRGRMVHWIKEDPTTSV